MGVIIPSIPYKSQLDSDASDYRNDCGPASLAMVLNGFDVEVTTNAVYRKTGAKANGYVSVSQLMRAGQAYGVPFDYFYNWNISNLKHMIQAGKPLVPLVHYGAWSQLDRGVSTQSQFLGPHFVVVVGFDDEHVYVNDPLWSGNRRHEGNRKKWTYAEFNQAWGTVHEDGYRDFSCIVTKNSLATENWLIEENGEPEPDAAPPKPIYIMEPDKFRAMQAWSVYFNIPLPEINDLAVATAYQSAMGEWGNRIISHKVQETDTLELLAQRYYADAIKWEVITYFNGIGVGDTIFDGDDLLIPEPLERPVDIPQDRIPMGGTHNFRRRQYAQPR